MRRAEESARKAVAAENAAQLAAAERVATDLRTQLEDAMASSVRLCVVAPTVNVTFGGSTANYKATLPKEQIRTTLEHDVLPSFTRSFVQAHERAAPPGGRAATMDEWLKDVTMSMQGSIEKHLARVFSAG